MEWCFCADIVAAFVVCIAECIGTLEGMQWDVSTHTHKKKKKKKCFRFSFQVSKAMLKMEK